MTNNKPEARPLRVAGRESMKELLSDLEGMTDFGIASVLRNASPERTDAEIQASVDEFRGRRADSSETRKPAQPVNLRSSIQHAIRSLQRVHSSLAEWEGTKIVRRDVVDMAVFRVLVTSSRLEEAAKESASRLDDMEGTSARLTFDGVPDGRLGSLLKGNEEDDQ